MFLIIMLYLLFLLKVISIIRIVVKRVRQGGPRLSLKIDRTRIEPYDSGINTDQYRKLVIIAKPAKQAI